MYSTEFTSIAFNSLNALTAPVIDATLGFIIGRSRPFSSAIVRKMWFKSSRFGRPNDIFDTPSTVLTPNLSFTARTALSVSFTASCSADAVSVRQSIAISSFGIPISSQRFIIFSAMATRCSALGGMPSLSSVRPTTAAPYFFTSGRTFLRLSSSPFTEFTIGLPLYTRSAASSTSGIVLSIWRGTLVTP